MEREILFRGKNNGEWVEGFYLYDGSREEHRITRYNSLLDKMVVYNIRDKETLGQYSGLKDKEGKKIFEGDIIELENYLGEKIRVVCKFGTARRVIYENECDITGFYFEYEGHFKTFPIVNNYAGKHDLELFEVIGNIYDNPELVIK